MALHSMPVLVMLWAASAVAQPPLQEARARLDAVVGDAMCIVDSDCASVAVGHRACGGPEFYLAWSARRTARAALDDAVTGYARARDGAMSAGDRFSTCEMIADPGAYCEPAFATGGAGGSCRLRPAGGARLVAPVR